MHEYYLLQALFHIIMNGLIFGAGTLYYRYNMVLYHSHDIIWMIGYFIIICIDGIIIITHLTSLRDAFIFELDTFLDVCTC